MDEVSRGMAPIAMAGGIRVHSRRLEQTPAAGLSLGFQPQCGKVQAEVPNCPWGSSPGYCYLSAPCLLWHLFLASLDDRTDGKIFCSRKIFLCLYAVFFFFFRVCAPSIAKCEEPGPQEQDRLLSSLVYYCQRTESL